MIKTICDACGTDEGVNYGVELFQRKHAGAEYTTVWRHEYCRSCCDKMYEASNRVHDEARRGRK